MVELRVILQLFPNATKHVYEFFVCLLAFVKLFPWDKFLALELTV